MRKLVSVVLAAGLLVSLAACTSGQRSNGCAPLYTSGSNSNLVTAKGKIGDDPQAKVPTPVIAKKTEVSTVIKGDGRVIQPGAVAVVQVSIYDASNGNVLITSDYTGPGVIGYVRDESPAFGAVVQCETIGSRVAAVGSVKNLLGEEAIAQYKLPVETDDTIILVADLLDSYLGKANGVDQPAQAGYPSIVTAPNGRPGFTFANDQKAPSAYRSAVLKAGNGAKVKEGDAVVLNYTGLEWGAKAVADTTWDGLPTVKVMADLSDNQNGVPKGLLKAIVGQKIGSQVIVVLTPDVGYPSGSAPSGVTDGSTLVYVVDILGIYK